jgi:hydrogenase-4 component B
VLTLLVGIGLLLLGGFAALAAGRAPRAVTGFGVGGALTGCLVGLVPAGQALWRGSIESFHLAWSVPYGSFNVGLDPLSAFFVVVVLALSAVCAVYGGAYLWPERTRHRLGPPWFFYNLLIASMVLVVIARNGVLFLAAWEVMTLASFFLVTFDGHRATVRDAGWTYLVAAHLGTAFLFALFLLLGRGADTLDFAGMGVAGRGLPVSAGVLLLLAVVGFGTKAGFMPLHVWLPEAHPAAPSHVSALMSGVMIKLGIYGLLRTLTFLGPPAAWWGWLFVAIGLTSGVLGVLFALAQPDLKRLLAYSSVENIGIIAVGLGVGLLGRSWDSAPLMVLGFAGALVHVLNHALFKGLLFLGAGAVLHETGTGAIDCLGGLFKRMPVTGLTFLIGAVAISALPPLNGFVSEFLIYLGAFEGLKAARATQLVPLAVAIGGLALAGGLAAACFTRAFGIAFLGEPRSTSAAEAHEPPAAMRGSMLALAAGCVLVAFSAPWGVVALGPVLTSVTGLPAGVVQAELATAVGPLTAVLQVSVALVVLVILLALARRRLLARRGVGQAVTWDCGYAAPTARMQYTAASFAQPLTSAFGVFLRTRTDRTAPQGDFPAGAALATDTPDVCRESFYRPVFAAVGRGLGRLRWVQHGRVQVYVLYIALTMVLLLVWKLS